MAILPISYPTKANGIIVEIKFSTSDNACFHPFVCCVAAREGNDQWRMSVVSPTGRFAYIEVDSPTQVKSIPVRVRGLPTDRSTAYPYGPPPKDHPQNRIKILLTVSPIDHSCRRNFERYAEKNVTDLGSGSGASFIIRDFKYFPFCLLCLCMKDRETSSSYLLFVDWKRCDFRSFQLVYI